MQPQMLEVRHNIDTLDGLGIRLDASSGHRDMPGTHNSTDTTADMKESISAHRNTTKQPNSHVKLERWPTHNQVELRSHAGMLIVHTGSHGMVDHTNTAGGMQRHVSTGLAEPLKLPDIPP